MTWPSVSIAFPCWRRGALLEKTLASIRRQCYPGHLDLIVVEEEDDGLTRQVAAAYGARYINNPRLEPYPLFQSITKLWNLCLHACTGEIAMLQTGEVLHEGSVIMDLVQRVCSGNKIMATPLIRELNQDGLPAGWYNHPREGTRPGWISGAGPHAFRREEMLQIGGYEEMFYGYGHEDDYFLHLLRANGWSIEYVESAVCAHQWHERFKFEPITGYANRALIRTLIMDIEEGRRKPLANYKPLEVEFDVTPKMLLNLIYDTWDYPFSETYKTWVDKCWLHGDKHPDVTFVAQRTVANEGRGLISELGEMITECAWSLTRLDEAVEESEKTSFPSWCNRCRHAALIHGTWATHAYSRARKLSLQWKSAS